jgi:transposase
VHEAAPQRDGGRRASRVEDVPATAREILALAGRLLADRVELVVMEATSDYWRIWYHLLEGAGLSVQLVNPAHARQPAGRRPTGSTRSGSPGWPRWACCARRSCRRRRSGRCAT